MRSITAFVGVALFSSAANSLELVHPENTPTDDIEVTLDCHAFASGGWIAIYAEEAKLYEYGNSQKDWFYLNQGGDDCLFAFSPRDEAGAYIVRRFETSSADEAAEELIIELTTGPGRPTEEPMKPAEVDSENFWISAPAAQLTRNETFKIGINCHVPGQVYSGRGMVIQLSEAGSNPGGNNSGKYREDWYHLKNLSEGNPCYYEFAGKPSGEYEVLVFQMGEPEVRVRLPITFASTTSGDPVKASFDINKIEQPIAKWDPVRGHNNCIKYVDSTTVKNLCRDPVSVTMLQLDNGTGYKPQEAMHVPAKEQQSLPFTAELSIGWFACKLDDAECMQVQSCLAVLRASWKSPYDTKSEVICNYSGKYIPL